MTDRPLRILIATQLAVAAFALIPSHPLDGDRLATQPIVLALMSLVTLAGATAAARLPRPVPTLD